MILFHIVLVFLFIKKQKRIYGCVTEKYYLNFGKVFFMQGFFRVYGNYYL